MDWSNGLCNCVCTRKPPQHTTHTNIFVFNVVCNHLGVVVNVHCTFIVCVQETTQKPHVALVLKPRKAR